VDDVQEDPTLGADRGGLLEGIHAVLAVPLLREDKVVGGLVIRRRTVGGFAPTIPVESRCGAVAVGRTYLLPPLTWGDYRSRGFVPSFSPFVSDPKSEPQCDPPRFTGARINLTYGRRSSAVVPISRLRAGRGSRGRDQSFVRPFKARGAGRSSTWI